MRRRALILAIECVEAWIEGRLRWWAWGKLPAEVRTKLRLGRNVWRGESICYRMRVRGGVSPKTSGGTIAESSFEGGYFEAAILCEGAKGVVIANNLVTGINPYEEMQR